MTTTTNPATDTPTVTTSIVDGQTISAYDTTPATQEIKETDTQPATTITPTATATQSAAAAEGGETGYTPVFSAAVRTVVYVVCLIVGGLGGAATVICALTSAPFWLTAASAIIAFVTPYVAAGFGVAYNPIRMAGK
jgi:hypothetical protein